MNFLPPRSCRGKLGRMQVFRLLLCPSQSHSATLTSRGHFRFYSVCFVCFVFIVQNDESKRTRWVTVGPQCCYALFPRLSCIASQLQIYIYIYIPVTFGTRLIERQSRTRSVFIENALIRRIFPFYMRRIVVFLARHGLFRTCCRYWQHVLSQPDISLWSKRQSHRIRAMGDIWHSNRPYLQLKRPQENLLILELLIR